MWAGKAAASAMTAPRRPADTAKQFKRRDPRSPTPELEQRPEALNNKVKLIVRRAYGFHSAQAALALVHLACGPVTLTLPHEQVFA
jgi:hypothetical protein